MLFLFDTNVVLAYLREHPAKDFINQKFRPFVSGNMPIISVVVIGELRSIAMRNKWGAARLSNLERFTKEFLIADINSEDILNAYAEIDTFSQGKLAGKPLGVSARNMGKNDLWIAATAAVTGAKLLSADNDFDHLNGTFLDFEKIDLGIS